MNANRRSDWGSLEDLPSEYDRCVLEAIYALDVIDLVAEPEWVSIIASNLVVALGTASGYDRIGRIVPTVKQIVQRNNWLRGQVGVNAEKGIGEFSPVILHFYPWDEDKYGPFESPGELIQSRDTLARSDFERIADSTPVDRSASRVASAKDTFVCLGFGKPFGTVKSLDLHRNYCGREAE